MIIVDNFQLLYNLLPPRFDGDTFWYTDLLDRSKRAGNNSGRRLATFWHRSQSEFLEQADQIRKCCNYFKARAYFRPTPRSFRMVGAMFTRHIVEQALTQNWEGMRHGYSHCVGVTPAKTQKIWVWDVDHMSETDLTRAFAGLPELVMVVPSKKGRHFLTRPFEYPKQLPIGFGNEAVLHRDNPTNLYIPADAA